MAVCPICGKTAEYVRAEGRGVRVVCENCGEFVLTGECLDYMEFEAKANLVAKAARWLRETKQVGPRMISSAPVHMDQPGIRDYVTLYNLKNMYVRKGTKDEYDSVLRNCLALQKKHGRDCVALDKALDIFPIVDEPEARVMARKMVAAGDLGRREENGVDCIFVTQAGLDRLASS